MAITIVQINSAIEGTLATATGLTNSQDYNELTEGMQDIPNLQVYWRSANQDPIGNTTQRSFRGGVKQTDLTFYADLYARQRSHIGEDMAALLPLVDAISAVLEAQKTKPLFFLFVIQALTSWRADQVVFEYGDPLLKYVGARFTITVRVF